MLESLKSKVYQSSVIVFSAFAVSRSLRLISNLILTRLLVPEVFGILSLIQIFIFTFGMLSDVGLTQNIIRSKNGHKPEFLNTVYTLQVIRGVFICLLLILVGFIIGYLQEVSFFEINSVYAEPDLPLAIVFMSLSQFILGFKTTKITVANRSLNVKRFTLIELFSQISSLIVMVVWAYVYRDIWAMVISSIVHPIIFVFLTNKYLPGANNKLHINKASFVEIFTFGKWLTVSSFFTIINLQGNKIFLTTISTAEFLGIFSIAFFLSTFPSELLKKISSSILFPALSEVNRENNEELLGVYYKIRRVTDAFSFFTAGFLIYTGTEVISLLYDERYASAGWILQILSFSLLFTGTSISSSLMLAIGNSKYCANFSFIHTFLLILITPIMYHIYGVDGVVCSVPVVAMTLYFFDCLYRYKLKVFYWKNEFKMVPVFAVGISVGWLFSWLIIRFFY